MKSPRKFSRRQAAALFLLSIAGAFGKAAFAQETGQTLPLVGDKGGVPAKPASDPSNSVPTEAETNVALTVSQNAAGFALFRILAANPHVMPDDGNLVLSPASLEPILLALEAGAAGETAESLAAILKPEGEAAPKLVPLEPDGEDAGTNGLTRAGVWIERGWEIKPAFTSTLKLGLGMETRISDFSKKAVEETAAINQWVSEATRERIPHLFEPSDLRSDTRMVLASALVYEGEWESPFDPKHSQPGPFRYGAGKTESIETILMHRQADFACSESADGVRVVSMPLENGKQRCVLMLPKEGGHPLEALRTLEKTLTVARYRELTAKLEDRSLDLRVPRLNLEVRSSIKAGLQLLGAGSLFLPSEADLSGISEEPDLCVSVMRHQVTVELDERGARGAAATGAAIVSRGFSAEPQTWTFDRPFVFAIEAVDSGEVLFLGRVVRPKSPQNEEAGE